MKVKVKATGKIVEVEPEPYIANDRWDIGIRFADDAGNIYRENQLDFENFTEELTDVKEVKKKSLPKDEPDYWEKLHHQAVISAMSAFLVRGYEPKETTQLSIELARIMVEKLKNEKL